MNPNKADDYLTLINAAAAYRNGEHIFARAVAESLADPIDDALHLIGVLMAVSVAEAGDRAGEGAGYVARRMDPDE